jgi:hypothetical protein
MRGSGFGWNPVVGGSNAGKKPPERIVNVYEEVIEAC